MSKHLGDFDAATLIYGKFTTYSPKSGASFTLAGSPVLSVYKDNSTTQSTAGVTLTADFDAVTGFNHFAVDTSADGTFYSAGSFFDVMISTGTVQNVSAVGTVVGSFTLRKNSALKPTTAGRALDVSAGGEAGLDWANVGSATTSLTLSGTTMGTATNLTNAPTSGDLTATMKTSITAAVPSATAIATAVADVFATAADAVAASPSPTTTAFAGSSSLSSTDSWYVGSVLLFTSGTLDGLARKITAYTGSSRLFTVASAWPVAPTAGDTFRILGRID